MDPGSMVSDSPVVAMASSGKDHKGPGRRGKTMNNSAAMGAPCNNSLPMSLTCVLLATGFFGSLSMQSACPSATTAGKVTSAERMLCE